MKIQFIEKTQLSVAKKHPCSTCNGVGIIYGLACSRCNGKKYFSNISIPMTAKTGDIFYIEKMEDGFEENTKDLTVFGGRVIRNLPTNLFHILANQLFIFTPAKSESYVGGAIIVAANSPNEAIEVFKQNETQFKLDQRLNDPQEHNLKYVNNEVHEWTGEGKDGWTKFKLTLQDHLFLTEDDAKSKEEAGTKFVLKQQYQIQEVTQGIKLIEIHDG